MIRLAACGFAALAAWQQPAGASTSGRRPARDSAGCIRAGWRSQSRSRKPPRAGFALPNPAATGLSSSSVIDGLYTIGVISPVQHEKVGGLRIEVGQQATVTIRLRPAGTQTSITVRRD